MISPARVSSSQLGEYRSTRRFLRWAAKVAVPFDFAQGRHGGQQGQSVPAQGVVDAAVACETAWRTMSPRRAWAWRALSDDWSGGMASASLPQNICFDSLCINIMRCFDQGVKLRIYWAAEQRRESAMMLACHPKRWYTVSRWQA